MAKGDDAVMRKRSRAHRNKSRSLHTSHSVSARVAAVIAAKHRRKSGKRRICEGMCFTLPTPEDPFNDRNDPKAHKDLQRDTRKNRRNNPPSLGDPDDGCPSKYLLLCLKAIQDAWSHDVTGDGAMGRPSPLLACRWGIDLWRSCCSGSDIVVSGASSSCASREQIVWLVSTASDIIATKEKQGLVVSTPFLVILVPSQEKAAEIRSVCKPLKPLGVHTVSLHPGAPLDHQIHGLKSCEPEFVVSTPERLLDLVTLKALDISCVSLLVIDGLESLISTGFLNELKSIREHISGDPQTVVFSGKHGEVSSVQLHNLVKEPVRKVHGPVIMEAAIKSEVTRKFI